MQNPHCILYITVFLYIGLFRGERHMASQEIQGELCHIDVINSVVRTVKVAENFLYLNFDLFSSPHSMSQLNSSLILPHHVWCPSLSSLAQQGLRTGVIPSFSRRWRSQHQLLLTASIVHSGMTSVQSLYTFYPV